MSPGISLQISPPLWTDDSGELGRGTGNGAASVPTSASQHWIWQQKLSKWESRREAMEDESIAASTHLHR